MIKKIVIEIGDKEFKLTLEEVEELRAELNRLKGETSYSPYTWIRPFDYAPYYYQTSGTSITVTNDNYDRNEVK